MVFDIMSCMLSPFTTLMAIPKISNLVLNPPVLNTLVARTRIMALSSSRRFLQNCSCVLLIRLASVSVRGAKVSVLILGPSLEPIWTCAGRCSALKGVTSGPGLALIEF